MKDNMRIDYFELCSSGVVYQTYIDTSDKKYISHTEDSVTFTYSYNSYIDCDSETKYEQITKTRIFDVIRQERINSYKELIKDLQDRLSVLENSANYEQYIELIYKNK